MVEFVMLIAGFLPALAGNSSNNLNTYTPVIYCSSKRMEFYDANAKLISASAITNDLSRKYCGRSNGGRSI